MWKLQRRCLLEIGIDRMNRDIFQGVRNACSVELRKTKRAASAEAVLKVRLFVVVVAGVSVW